MEKLKSKKKEAQATCIGKKRGATTASQLPLPEQKSETCANPF